MIKFLKRKAAAEKEKMSGMSRADKAVYIWDYYKVHILLLLAFIALIIGLCWQLLFNSQETVYHFAIINEEMNVEKDSALKTSLSDWLGLNPRTEEVMVDSNYNIPYLYNESSEPAYLDGTPASDFSTYEKYFLNLSKNVIDAAVMPESFMEYCNSLDRSYCDLTELFPEDVLLRYEERFCWGTDVNGEKYLCGLYTDGTVFDAGYFAQSADETLREAYGRQVLAFPVGGGHPENNEMFLRWVFENEATAIP